MPISMIQPPTCLGVEALVELGVEAKARLQQAVLNDGCTAVCRIIGQKSRCLEGKEMKRGSRSLPMTGIKRRRICSPGLPPSTAALSLNGQINL